MSDTLQIALDRLRDIGNVDPVSTLPPRLRANAHVHLPPNFSAFETVEQALNFAANQNISLLGVSNYYDYEVYGDFADLARKHKIFPLFGLEIICQIEPLRQAGIKINDPANPGKMYLCGKGITRFAPFNDAAMGILQTIRKNDSQRIAEMIDRLRGIFDRHDIRTDLTSDAVIDRVVARHHAPRRRVYLQERHICLAFQEKLFDLIPPDRRVAVLEKLFSAPTKCEPADAVGIQNEIRSHLLKSGKPGFVPETFISFEDAHRLVLELGGIPCYPILADGAKPIGQFEDPAEELVDILKEMNIHLAEFIPMRNAPAVLDRYAKALRGAGIALTAGTEHNTLDMIPIEPTCLNKQPIPDDLKDIFWEGACVISAHQFLALNAKPGYVDPEGRPNTDFSNAESRIDHFRRLGAAVIQRYRQSHGQSS